MPIRQLWEINGNAISPLNVVPWFDDWISNGTCKLPVNAQGCFACVPGSQECQLLFVDRATTQDWLTTYTGRVSSDCGFAVRRCLNCRLTCDDKAGISRASLQVRAYYSNNCSGAYWNLLTIPETYSSVFNPTFSSKLKLWEWLIGDFANVRDRILCRGVAECPCTHGRCVCAAVGEQARGRQLVRQRVPEQHKLSVRLLILHREA
jgi:hypothetical protein